MQRNTSDAVENQRLKVQTLVIRAADTHLFVDDGADIVLLIGQPVAAVVSATHQNAAGGADGAGLTTKAAAACVISDSSSPYAAAGDLSAIRLVGVQLATAELVRVEYILA